MDISTFRKIANGLSPEKINNFRKQMRGSYLIFCAEKEIDIEEQQYMNHTEEWDVVYYKRAYTILNDLSIDIENEVKSLKSHWDDTFEFPYYPYRMNQFWTAIENLNDVDFAYGIITFSRQLSLNAELSNFLTRTINKHLTQNGLKILMQERKDKNIFIAMSFDKTMIKARKTIIKAIEDANYQAIVVDEVQHNRQIVEEIIYQIDNCNFLIADLTQHKNGVYYEAGMAQALGKPVIYTCRGDDFQNRHFDVNQINTIRWDNEQELYDFLLKRIRATIGEFVAVE